jgi:hypothetical protein
MKVSASFSNKTQKISKANMIWNPKQKYGTLRKTLVVNNMHKDDLLSVSPLLAEKYLVAVVGLFKVFLISQNMEEEAL